MICAVMVKSAAGRKVRVWIYTTSYTKASTSRLSDQVQRLLVMESMQVVVAGAEEQERRSCPAVHRKDHSRAAAKSPTTRIHPSSFARLET